MPATVQPIGVQSGGQCEGIVASFGPVGVKAKLPGIMARAEKSRILAGPGERAFDQAGRQGDAARHAVAPASHAVEHSRIAREIVSRGNAIKIVRPTRAGGMAGQDAVDSQQVVALGMRHRKDECQLACA